MNPTLPVLALAACILLASCSDPAPSDPLLEKANSGDATAQYELALRYQDQGLTDDARTWLLASQKSGYNPAILKLATEQIAAQDGSQSKALASIESLANEKDRAAILYLADYYDRNAQTADGREKSSRFYQLASEQGDPYARYRVLLDHWLTDRASISADELQKIKTEIYTIATEQDPRAFSLYARILDEEGNISDADKRHLTAANAGDPYSMYRIGIAYHRHVGDRTYGPLGFEYLTKAAQAGVVEALLPLSKAYYKGNGTTINRDKSEAYAKMGAWLGDPVAFQLFAVIAKKNSDSWNIEERIELAALIDFAKERNFAVANIFSAAVNPKGKIFAQLVKQKREQLEAAAVAFLSSQRSDLVAPIDISEAFKLPSSLALYGEDAGIAGNALETFQGEQLLQFALNCFDPEKPYHNTQRGIDWLKDSISTGYSPACLELYERFEKEPEASGVDAKDAILALQVANMETNPTASLYLAKEYKLGRWIDKNDELAMAKAEEAYKAGHPDAFEFLKGIINDGPKIIMNSQLGLDAIDALADEGSERAQFARSSYRVSRFLFKLHYENQQDAKDGIPTQRPLKDEFVLRFIPSEDYIHIWSANIGDLIRGRPIPDQVKTAIDEIVTLADNGYVLALETCAIWHIRGHFLEKDADKALAYFANAQELSNSPIFFYIIGDAYLTPETIGPDMVKGSVLLRKAAELDDREAIKLFNDLGGIEDTPDDEELYTFVEIAYRASLQEDPEFMYKLACFFRFDSEYDKEYSDQQYRYWLGEAAKRDNHNALIMICNNYLLGEGVEKNPRRALRYLKRSADLGSALSQYSYGFYLAGGLEIEKNTEEALKYLRLSADQGIRKAQTLIANLENTNSGEIPLGEEDSNILELLIASELGHDTFPVAPYFIQGEKLYPLDQVIRSRPSTHDGELPIYGAKDQEAVLLAGDDYHSKRVSIEEALIMAPVIYLNGAMIFTGNKPSITIQLKSDEPIEDLNVLLLIKQGHRKAKYVWRNVKNIAANESKKIVLRHDDQYVEPQDIAIYFFADGKEVLSNARVQPNNFLDEKLATWFSIDKETYLEENKTNSLASSIAKPFPEFFDAPIYPPLGETAKVELNELGYIKAIELPETVSGNARNEILLNLPYIVFKPALEAGTPIASSAKLSFE